jgi:hypothetical protein
VQPVHPDQLTVLIGNGLQAPSFYWVSRIAPCLGVGRPMLRVGSQANAAASLIVVSASPTGYDNPVAAFGG